MKTALTIAGSDSSGGAGIQADLKAMTMNGVFAMSAITALTAQNTTGVSGIFEVSPEFLAQQIDAVFTDIRPCAIKIGMVSSAPLIEMIAERLRFYKAEHIVVDPVMVATSGSDLIASDAVRTLRRELFPLAEVITPNRHEAEVLSGLHISGRADMSAAARAIVTRPALVLADEPTGALDSKSSRLLLERLEVLNRERGATILMVTHDAFTASCCRRVVFLRDGKIFAQLERDGGDRRALFQQIIRVVTQLGGEMEDVL